MVTNYQITFFTPIFDKRILICRIRDKENRHDTMRRFIDRRPQLYGELQLGGQSEIRKKKDITFQCVLFIKFQIRSRLDVT